MARLSCTSCGPRYSHTLIPLRPHPLSWPPFVLLILSSHFTAIAIALPNVGFQSNPRDPGKVWLFNFLPRGPSALAFLFSLFMSFRASRSRYSLHIPLVSSSLVPRGRSTSRGTIVLLSSFYIVRRKITSGEKICDLREGYIQSMLLCAAGSENVSCVCNPPLSQ